MARKANFEKIPEDGFKHIRVSGRVWNKIVDGSAEGESIDDVLQHLLGVEEVEENNPEPITGLEPLEEMDDLPF